MAEGRPSTFAMPSPATLTVPTSSREAASGLYDWTKFSSASRISSGRIVSSAIWVPCSPCWARSFLRGSGGRPPGIFCSLCTAQLGPLVMLVAVAAAGAQPAIRRAASSRRSAMVPLMTSSPTRTVIPPRTVGVHVEVQVHLPAVQLRQCGAEALLLLVAQRHRRGDHRDHAVPALRGQLGQGLESRLQATSPRLGRQAASTSRSVTGLRPAAEQAAQQLGLGRGRRRSGRSARRRSSLCRSDDPAEPEQLVLDVVERVRRAGRR